MGWWNISDQKDAVIGDTVLDPTRNDLIKKLEKHGWIFEHTDIISETEDNKKIEIIKKTSTNFYKWCSFFDALYSSAEDEWFLSLNDFRNNSDSSFSWNEFEKICIESCSSPEEEIEIRNFWSGHLPIFMSTKNGYQYWAMKTSGENTGAIYYGREPEFEEVTKIAENFDDLIKKISLSLDTNNKILGIYF